MSVRISQRQGLFVLAGWLLCGGIAGAQPMTAHSPQPIANFILGGGDRHCSSFNGEAAGRGCTADWSTILAHDPALMGRTLSEISFEAYAPKIDFRYSLTRQTLQRIQGIPDPLLDATRKLALHALLEDLLASRGQQLHMDFAALDMLAGESGWVQRIGLSPAEEGGG